MIKVNLKTIWVPVITGLLAHSILMGTLQQYIYFADPLNEIASFLLLGVATVLGLVNSVSKG